MIRFIRKPFPSYFLNDLIFVQIAPKICMELENQQEWLIGMCKIKSKIVISILGKNVFHSRLKLIIGGQFNLLTSLMCNRQQNKKCVIRMLGGDYKKWSVLLKRCSRLHNNVEQVSVGWLSSWSLWASRKNLIKWEATSISKPLLIEYLWCFCYCCFFFFCNVTSPSGS